MQALLGAAAAVVAAALTGPGAPPAPVLKLDNVRLLVDRFDEAYAFYKDVLGLQVTSGKPGENYASFAFAGGGQIALFRRAAMADVVGTAAGSSARAAQD